MFNRRAALGGIAGSALLAGCNPVAQASGQAATLRPSLTVRRREDRGGRDLGWLQANHSFSFAQFRDPDYNSFGPLRVLNEDFIAAGRGFPMHPHRDMEIVTYVMEGELEHKDSLGFGGIIRPGLVQRMSAGTGVYHSEFNPRPDMKTHLMQIWLLPDRSGHKPGYADRFFAPQERHNELRLVVSGDGRENSLAINQDTNLYASLMQPKRRLSFTVRPGRKAWLQLAKGSLDLNGTSVRRSDGVAVSSAGVLELTAGPKGAELLLFDVT